MSCGNPSDKIETIGLAERKIGDHQVGLSARDRLESIPRVSGLGADDEVRTQR